MESLLTQRYTHKNNHSINASYVELEIRVEDNNK